MKAMIFAAGKGTRLQPFTLNHPKALAKVNGVALLERNILYLKSFGIQEIVINTHHFAEQIEAFLSANQNFGCTIHLSREEELLETGGGLINAKKYLEGTESFVVLNADILTNLDLLPLIAQHKASGCLATLAVSERESSRQLLFDSDRRLCGWKNNATGEEIRSHSRAVASSYAFSGIHCISPELLSLPHPKGAFSIMHSYLELMDAHPIAGYLHRSILVDVGRNSSIAEAEKYFK